MSAAQERQQQCWTKVFSEACTSTHPMNESGSTSTGQCKCLTQCQGRAGHAHTYRRIPAPALQHQYHSDKRKGLCGSGRAILAHQFKKCWTVFTLVWVMVNPLLACTLLKQNRLGKGSHTHKAEMGGGAGKQFIPCNNSWLKPGITAELAPMKSCKKPYRAAAFSMVTAKSTLQQPRVPGREAVKLLGALMCGHVTATRQQGRAHCPPQWQEMVNNYSQDKSKG